MSALNGVFDDLKRQFQRGGNVVTQLIIINAAVFLLLDGLVAILAGPDTYHTFRTWLLLPSEVLPHPTYDLPFFIRQPWSILTYGFFHFGLSHIIGNMIGLYFFGRLIQDYLGGAKVLILYVLGVLVGGGAYLMVEALNLFGENYGTLQGASAGVMAIIIGAVVLLPNHTFHLLLLGPVRIMWIGLVYFLINFYYIAQNDNVGGNVAHIGGAIIGYLYITQLQKGTDLGGWIIRAMDWIKNLFKPKPKIRVTYRNPNAGTTTSKAKGSRKSSKGKAAGATGSGSVSEEEINAILEKISAGGYESLTKEEKQRLFNASNQK